MNKDEEYFRTIMCLQERTGKHPVARRLMKGAVVRAFANSPKFKDMIMSTARVDMVRNPFGLVYPNATMEVKWDRIERVLRKITKGLFYFFNKYTLPDEYDVQVRPCIPDNLFNELVPVFEKSSHIGPFGVGEEWPVWFYAARQPSNPNSTFWLFSFYGSHPALTFTFPRGLDPEKDEDILLARDRYLAKQDVSSPQDKV